MAKSKMAKVKKLIKEIPEWQQDIAKTLLSELEFMQNTLGSLKEKIEREGEVTLFKQGTQEFLKEHPALKSYSTLIQRYSLVSKQLTDLLPKENQTEAQDELITFIKGVK